MNLRVLTCTSHYPIVCIVYIRHGKYNCIDRIEEELLSVYVRICIELLN